MQGSTPVTLRDVARAAGVSTASASRALSGMGTVGAELRLRILAAAERLGYTPNLAARSLAARRSRLVGVMVGHLVDPLIADAVLALERSLATAGYGALIAGTREAPDQDLDVLRKWLGRGAEALVLVEAAEAEEVAAEASKRGLPCLVVGDANRDGEPVIAIGRRNGAALAGRYLVELGHRRVSVIAARHTGTASGVAEALAERGVSLLSGGIVPARDVDAAAAALRRLVQRADPPTAVICSSDLHALAALRACREEGIAVPGAVSIVGFGDAPFARRCAPALTTVRASASQIGDLLAESLIDCLERGGSPKALEAQVKLVVRESTGPVAR